MAPTRPRRDLQRSWPRREPMATGPRFETSRRTPPPAQVSWRDDREGSPMDFRPRRAARRPPIRRTRSPGTSSSTPPGRSRPGHRSVDPAVLRACIVAAAASKGITPRRRCSPRRVSVSETEVSISNLRTTRGGIRTTDRPLAPDRVGATPGRFPPGGAAVRMGRRHRVRASGVQREVSSFSPAIE